MRTIRIDEDVWSYLQSKAKPLEDNPNDVLRREFRLNSIAGPNGSNGHQMPVVGVGATRGTSKIDKDYTHQSVSGFLLGKRTFPARSFKDVLVNLCNHLRYTHGADFDKAALKQHGTMRSYFSETGNDLKFAQQLSGKGLFVETNLNANLIVKICASLLAELGYDAHEFQIT